MWRGGYASAADSAVQIVWNWEPLGAEVQEPVFGYKPMATDIFMLVHLANKWRDVTCAEDVY